MVVQLAGVGAICLAGAWFYLQNEKAKQGSTPARSASTNTILIDGTGWEVQGYEGIGLPSKPLNLRGCFDFGETVPQGPVAPEPRPPVGPEWFSCFDGARIAEDLGAGRARAILAARDDRPGIDRIIAIYPDGRAYQWRQTARPE